MYQLGRVIEHDPRSRAYAISEVDPTALRSVVWTRHAPVFNQGSIGSCTGNACLGALGTGSLYAALQKFNCLPPFTQDQAVKMYSAATVLDNFPGVYPPEDTGSSGLAVAKVAQAQGYLSGYTHAFTLNAVLSGLQSGPLISGVGWYSSFFKPNSEGECQIQTGSSVEGGHEICLDALGLETERIWFTNSWGSSWGQGGRAWFSFDTFKRLMYERGDVTRLIPATEPPPVPVTPEDTKRGCLLPFWYKTRERRP